MRYVTLPDNRVRPLPFYLAMEEFLAKNFDEDFFFMWQVKPTVIFGRNQLIDTEVDIDYCNRNGIEVYRRKSGGGCVFADMSNIMFSYITTSDHITTTFSHYTDSVAAMLRQLGLDATATGRNDVLIGDRKVSGNAFYHLRHRAIVHGTMLYDTDMSHIAKAITPSQSKLQSKGVESVRSHITTIREHLDISIDEFKEFARHEMTDGTLVLTDTDLETIERIAAPYFSREWIYGNNPRCNRRECIRIDGVGEFTAEVELSGNRIADINLSGDFFLLGDLDSSLLDRLKGTEYTRESIVEAVNGIDVSDTIPGLTNSQFINMLI